ncbi:hypothetical protein ACFWHV_32225 [Streptomyces collinus]|uniref:hypothetical protein n=1 Tax=Streptomyces collinus TaxID=42684 RepID=UPI00364E765E
MTNPPAAPFAAPGRVRPALSPAAVKLLAECRAAKDAAYTASVETAGLPGTPTVTAVRGEVQFVVHPESLADWRRWLHDLGAGDVRGESTGASMVVRCSYGGVPARLVGVGVPALYGERPPMRSHKPAGVRP